MQDQSALNIILYVRRWPGDPVPPNPMIGKYISNPVQVDTSIIWRRPPKDDPTVASKKLEVVSRKRDKTGALPYLQYLKYRNI